MAIFIARDLYRCKVKLILEDGTEEELDTHEARLLASALEEATGITPHADRIADLERQIEQLKHSNASLRGASKRRRGKGDR